MNPNSIEEPSRNEQTEPVISERQSADWDIQNAPKNYISLILAQVGTAFFSFASVWLITTTIGAEGYGEIVALIAASYLILILLNWSSFALPRFGVEEFVQTGKITKTFWTRSSILLPNLLLLLAGAVFFLKPLGELLEIPDSALWLIAFHFFSSAIWIHFQYSLQGVKLHRLQGTLVAFERGLTFVGLLILIAAGKISFDYFVWCYILPPLILSVAGWIILRPFIEMKNFFDGEWFRKMMIFSLPLIPFSLVGYFLTSQLDAVFITQFLSKTDLGIYSVATQINGMSLQLPILANSLILSLFVSLNSMGQSKSVYNYIKNALPVISLGWGVFCVVLAIVAGLFIPFVFGIEFREAREPLFILLLSSAFYAPAIFGYSSLSQSLSATYIAMISSILGAVINVTLNFWLIPRFGLFGCAVATLFSVSVSCLAIVGLCQRHFRFPLRNLTVSLIPVCFAIIGILIFGKIYIAAFFYLIGLIFSSIFLRGAIKEFCQKIIKNHISRRVVTN
ncbi:MAG TPA: polysaccharide biosynthesis C-terminal domain-containing protein [Pyrinomonadaceae bacterium]|nr:polysaccharide biosynthesis C-terminal domain-containing protein [Pyrinomonadaceae bacterium]